MRKFAVVKDEFLKYDVKAEDVKMPRRATVASVAYDFYSPIDYVLMPNETKLIFTNIKFYAEEDEGLFLATSSGMGKKEVMLAQGIGVIESDYVDNPTNDGNVGFMLFNHGSQPYEIKKGDKLGHAWFQKFLTVDDEIPPTAVRTGGFGSTLKNNK